MYGVVWRYSTHSTGHVSSSEFYKPYLTIEKYSSLHNDILFVSVFFGSTYICEKLLKKMKYRKSKILSEISDKLLESSPRLAATIIKPDMLVSQKQGHISR